MKNHPPTAIYIAAAFCITLVAFSVTAFADAVPQKATSITLPKSWTYTAPLISPEKRSDHISHAQKDPTVVHHNGKWHVFMTIKLQGRSIIEHCAFKDWKDANSAKRNVLDLHDGNYWCAPQVFYFTPHKKWYLVYQVGGIPGQKKMWVAYSTTSDIDDPTSWTRAKPMLDGGPNDPRTVGGLDYWIICDDDKAYLFYTSLNGKMWRLWTTRKEFPQGFRDCKLALQDNIFEASHTYRIKGAKDGQPRYITLIEENGRRYFKAYLADRLDGEWKPLAATAQNPFASNRNTRPAPGVQPWTDNISHGELLRDSSDEFLIIDPNNLRFIFQGMWNKDKAGKGYGRFNWRIGMLKPTTN